MSPINRILSLPAAAIRQPANYDTFDTTYGQIFRTKIGQVCAELTKESLKRNHKCNIAHAQQSRHRLRHRTGRPRPMKGLALGSQEEQRASWEDRLLAFHSEHWILAV